MSSSSEFRDITREAGGPDDRKLKEWEQILVGKRFVEGDVAEASEEATFTRELLPHPSRVCKPGGLFTMDYNTERLNVHLDGNNKCTHVTLG
ncbi:hypothetical protein BDZ91DRAFT_789100 [Kalaharituber pfeilii]|nr:hypothetical protein BDZ91DRAFT_789100 [Kalaharituber pfeilii]